jgi:hypothetical protein
MLHRASELVEEIWERGAEENISTWEGGSGDRVEKTT